MDRLPTVAATCLMSMTWTTLGKDKIGRRLQVESASMGQRLGLYNGPLDSHSGAAKIDDDKLEIAAAATAWGSFNFQM